MKVYSSGVVSADAMSTVIEGERATLYYLPTELVPRWMGNAQRVEVQSFRVGRSSSPQNLGDRLNVEFVLRGARKAWTGIETSRPSLVIIDGWGHPEILGGVIVDGGSRSSRWTLFAPEWRLEMDAFLNAYLRDNTNVRVLADYRERDDSRTDQSLPVQYGPSSHAPIATRPGTDLDSDAEKPSRIPRPLSRTPPRPTIHSAKPPDEVSLALQEKATAGHHQILLALESALSAKGWIDIEEIPCAIDLWARQPLLGLRVIFEAKTITAQNELDQTRHACAQLFEYRLLYGAPTDRLCIVANCAVSQTRVDLLEKLGVAVLCRSGPGFASSGHLWRRWVRS